MVAVMAVLMVGGEHSTEDDSTQDPLGLRSLNPVSERCLSNGQDNFVLDTIFALIDDYIAADLSSRPRFPCSRAAGPYIRNSLVPLLYSRLTVTGAIGITPGLSVSLAFP